MILIQLEILLKADSFPKRWSGISDIQVDKDRNLWATTNNQGCYKIQK